MKRNGWANFKVHHSNSVGLFERQYYQFPLYLYTDIPVETSMWTVEALPSLQYSFLPKTALLNVIIVNIRCICTLTFPLKLQYEP
jgi:hypothetical protein